MATFECKVYKLKIEEHPNADVLELAVVGDYRSIVRKGQFKTGDLGVYIPEAAVLPEWLIASLGLEGKLAGKQKNRVKAVRLRGVLSQGLVYPATDVSVDAAYPEYAIELHNDVAGTFGMTKVFYPVKEGSVVTEELGITKYEPPIPVHMAGEVFNAHGMTLKYDIENAKKFPDVLQEGEEVVMTEKIHGCVSPDTLVMLPNGEEVPIEDVIGDDAITHVMSYDVETKKFKPKSITAKFRRPNTENKHWVRLTLENGRVLKITEDHPVFSNERNAYVPAKDIRPNEDIKSPI